jgi:hypothetical protein
VITYSDNDFEWRMTPAKDGQLWSNAAAGEGCGRWRSNGGCRGGSEKWLSMMWWRKIAWRRRWQWMSQWREDGEAVEGTVGGGHRRWRA